MKLAIMQPYFLPYLGYWQLIQSADVFILFDDVQFIRHGWINRNRVLKPKSGWQYIMVPLQKHSCRARIKEIQAHPDVDWKSKILRQLEHYKHDHKIRAPYFAEVMTLLSDLFSSLNTTRLVEINAHLIRGISAYLNISTRLEISSDCGFDYDQVEGPGEWALRMAQQMQATQYINPINGRDLFSANKFRDLGIDLVFLKSTGCSYDQRRSFEPNLSIVDALMFNGREGTKRWLHAFEMEGS